MQDAFPKRIDDIRQRLGLSQRAFADFLGMSDTGVRKWLSGDAGPTRKNLDKIMRKLGLSYGAVTGTEPLPDDFPRPEILGTLPGAAQGERMLNAQMLLQTMKHIRDLQQQQAKLQAEQLRALDSLIRAAEREDEHERGDADPPARPDESGAAH